MSNTFFSIHQILHSSDLLKEEKKTACIDIVYHSIVPPLAPIQTYTQATDGGKHTHTHAGRKFKTNFITVLFHLTFDYILILLVLLKIFLCFSLSLIHSFSWSIGCCQLVGTTVRTLSDLQHAIILLFFQHPILAFIDKSNCKYHRVHACLRFIYNSVRSHHLFYFIFIHTRTLRIRPLVTLFSMHFK